MHQRVDLQLRIFKGVRRWILHLLVDHLSNPGIQTDLRGKTMTSSRYLTLSDRFWFLFMSCYTCITWISYNMWSDQSTAHFLFESTKNKSFNCY